MGKIFYKRKGAPKPTRYNNVELSTIPEGGVVWLNESGIPVEFYVAKHDYESELNGVGRTLLVRKDCYDYRLWDSTGKNLYVISDIDLWLNGEYKNLLDPIVQEAIKETKFVCTKRYGSVAINTATRSVFLLSVAELGKEYTITNNTEGTTLPIASTLRTAFYNGVRVRFWTRSPNTSNTGAAWAQQDSNVFGTHTVELETVASRPCFTLPATALFDKNTMAFKGVL